MRSFILFLLASFTTMVSLHAKEGVKIVSNTKDLKSNTISSTNVFISDTKVVIENKGKDNSSIIFDASAEIFTYVDNSKKEYYQFDKATLVQLKEQVKMFATMMKQFASQMPEDQKKKLDKIMNPSSGGPVTYSKSPTSEKVKSWTTTRYEGKQGADKVMSVYIASFESVGVAKDKFSAMNKMMDFAKENLQEISGLLPASGGLSGMSFDDESPILNEGLPVKTLAYDKGVAKNENTVEEVVLSDIPEAKFSIPSGYTRKTVDIQNQLGK